MQILDVLAVSLCCRELSSRLHPQTSVKERHRASHGPYQPKDSNTFRKHRSAVPHGAQSSQAILPIIHVRVNAPVPEMVARECRRSMRGVS